MDKTEIIKNIATRGNGEIYLGVVGAVRTGKSTFIKRFIENLVIPNIESEYERKRCLDELPQSAQGKTIMTTEPKFVPSNGAVIKIEEFTTNIRLIDCVGYVIPNSLGYEDENGNPRLVKTPWFESNLPFIEAAEIGTEKVIKDHSTIGIVVATDGSFGELERKDYIEAEEKIIMELKNIGKPFIVVLNSNYPNNVETRELAKELELNYEVPVIPISVENMNKEEIMEILKKALYEFPILEVEINVPEWITVLNDSHEVKKHYLEKIKESVISVDKLKSVETIIQHFDNSEYISKSYISNVDAGKGIVTINLSSPSELYDQVLKSIIGDTLTTKASLIKIFSDYSSGNKATEYIKNAINSARTTGYGIVYPSLNDMTLSTPEIIKQGSRFGVKLKALASSYHIIKVDVESTFEPIIGSELQSKELIQYLMKDYELDPNNIWRSEVFGRSIDNIVNEGIQAKLSIMPENIKFKMSQTVTKIVNKGSSNLIAIVI